MIAPVIEKKFIQLIHPPRSGKTTLLNTIGIFLEKKLNAAGDKD